MFEASRRLRKLKRELIKELPFYPNNNETKKELEDTHSRNLLLYYLHWKSRLIPCRKRKIIYMPELTNDPRYKTLKLNIDQLFHKVRNAENINHCLSSKVYRNGYVSEAHKKAGKLSIWDDKDFVLNTMGYHHFHLSLDKVNNNISGRTNELLFAQVTRDSFKAIAIFDHSVFDNSKMSEERKRMYDIFTKYAEMFLKPGSIYIPSVIGGNGHPFHILQLSDEYSRYIYELDPQLDDRAFVNKLYRDCNLEVPNRYEFIWSFYGLDLNLLNKKDKKEFVIREGYI
ncbi:hypothetical protein LO80_05905 [Candidatus Francisella endociliophora]|uniref:Uncharacterized protein n=1 Tax=Candidatus Francisella endociliophora TaxID=653937 RepID=A0A097EPP5_9GAMM|nr:hypothetical protein [Francisella sp. FSC1006]AIT09542.1 hypothetical protein LO80_05905 [Francisella sp. FSC1006]